MMEEVVKVKDNNVGSYSSIISLAITGEEIGVIGGKYYFRLSHTKYKKGA